MPKSSRVSVFLAIFLGALAGALCIGGSAQARSWEEILSAARGQTVYFNAWGGDPRTNDFIAYVGEEASRRYGVKVQQVKLNDTAEAVTRVVAEKANGRNEGGSVDLIWINGPNFLAMKSQKLLFGPFADGLPNFRYVDTTHTQTNLIDFTVPVDGLEAPWRKAQLVFLYDSARTKLVDLPKSIPAMLDWAKAHPGRLTHPNVRNFMGASFLKQALYELAPDPKVLQSPASDANLDAVTAPLWRWYDQLKPLLWHQGSQFPESATTQRQLLADGEIDLSISFDPAEAAADIATGVLPRTARVYVLDRGTIGNTSFVAIPYNAAHKEGAMVVANLLLGPAIQARAQDPKVLGSFTVLDMDKLSPEQRKAFDPPADAPGLPANAELKASLPEPHPSWMTRIVSEWEKRYVK